MRKLPYALFLAQSITVCQKNNGIFVRVIEWVRIAKNSEKSDFWIVFEKFLNRSFSTFHMWKFHSFEISANIPNFWPRAISRQTFDLFLDTREFSLFSAHSFCRAALGSRFFQTVWRFLFDIDPIWTQKVHSRDVL